MSINIPELNEKYRITQFKQKEYLLKYTKGSQLQRNSFICASPELHSQEILPIETAKEIVALTSITNIPSSLKKERIEDNTIIRLMYIYTSAAVEWVKSTSGVENETIVNDIINRSVTLSLLESQLTLDNSHINIKLELCHIGQTNYGTKTLPNALNDVIADNDGKMDEIHGIREAKDIDIVVLINGFVGYNQSAGISYPLANNIGDRIKNGFVAVEVRYVFSDYVVIHEIGHTLGCHHHIEQKCEPAPFNRLYKYGTAWKGVIDNEYYITLMGYAQSECHENNRSHGRIPYFSSPANNLLGVVVGNDSLSDNVRVMNESRFLVETYGKGMQISAKTFYRKTYGYPDPTVEGLINKHNFDFRAGDKVVFTREAGESVGEYDIIPRITDTG